ncbi:hypothetical protein AAG906_021657 [Vitis piasezkii]
MVFELEAQHTVFGQPCASLSFSSLVRHHFQAVAFGITHPHHSRRNDFVNNYYLVPNSTRSRQFTLPNYVCYLISKCQKSNGNSPSMLTYMYGLNLWLQRLYKLGARRVFAAELQQDQRWRFHGPFTWL